MRLVSGYGRKDSNRERSSTSRSPEVGVPITEMDLFDDIGIDDTTGIISIGFHLTAPFCPPMFALEIAQDIKRSGCLIGVKEVKFL